MSDGVVFGSSKQAGLWRALTSADSNKNPERRIKGITETLNAVLLTDEKCDSAILCRLIEIVAHEEAQGWTEDIRDLVAHSRPRDCHPALTAALCLARKGLLTDAETYIEQLGEAPDKAMYYLVKAQIELARENDREAIGNLNLALFSDKMQHEIYVLLSRVDERVNWAAVEACERLAAGLSFEEPVDDGLPELQLYRIYREWYRGNRETATRMLMASPEFDEKVPAYCILSARMSRDEGDWHSAQMMLEEASRAIESDVSLLCELGNAYLGGGNYDLALARFRNAEAFDIGNPEVVRGMIKSNMALGKNNEALQSISEFLDSEMSTHDDYVEFTRDLLTMGFFTEAAEAAMKLNASYPGDATACIVLSKVAINEGNYREAEKYAREGVSANKNNAESLAQLAHVYLAVRRVSKAAAYAKKAVAADRTSPVALMAQVEIFRETGDNDRAVEACRALLEIDPANTEAANILSTLELSRIVKESDTSEALPQIVGAEDFVRLISTLMEDGKYTEVEKLCKDNDHKYGSVMEVRRIRGNAQYALGEYLKASASFASAAVLMKDDAEIWHSKGLADEKFGDFDSAEEAFGRAILLDMNNPAYWISNGCIKEKKGDFSAAVKSFNRAIELDPRSSYALVRKAAIFASSGMYSEALNFMELAEATDPKNINLQIVKMKICLKAARYTDAVYIGKKLMKKDPDASTVATYARANIALKDFGLAKKLLDKALASDPDNYELLTAYKELAYQTQDIDETIRVCNEILKVNPLDSSAKRSLADALMKRGRSDEANLIYSSIHAESEEEAGGKEETNDPAELFDIAKSMLDAGDLVSAARLADRAMAADPDNIDYALLRASIYRKSGDKRVADMFLSQYLERNPTNGSVHEAIGDIRVEDGDLNGAASAYSKAIQSGIKKPILFVKLGRIQERLGAYANAATNYNTAVLLDPHDAEASRSLAYVQFRTKDFDAALRSIQSSIAAEPSGEAYAILAMIYQARKDRAGVRDAYQGFLRFDSMGEEWVQAVVTALNSVGLRTEATLLKGRIGDVSEEESADVSPVIKRCAERLMRRAYMMGADFKDPDIAEGAGSDTATTQNALAYLADIPDYGEVIYGTNECERMENLSYHMVYRAKNKDLETVTVDTAYVAGGAKDVDEAKLLLAYVRSAMVSKLPREIPPEFVAIGEHTRKEDTLEQIMLDNKIGVFSARMVKASVKSQ